MRTVSFHDSNSCKCSYLNLTGIHGSDIKKDNSASSK